MPEKKRRRRKDARPDEIIDAALQEFAANGFSGTSMASIAARANIARSTVYLYFDDKTAVIERAFEAKVGKAIREAVGLVSTLASPFEEVIRQFLERIYHTFLQSDLLVLFKVLISEGQQFPELLKTYHQTVLSAAQGMLRSLLKEGVTRGEIRPEILNYDVKLVIAPVIVTAVWQLTFQAIDPIDLPRFIDGHIMLLSRGILT